MPTTSWLCGGILNNANKVKFLLHVLSTLGEKGGRIWHSENCDGLSYLHPLFAWFLFVCLLLFFLPNPVTTMNILYVFLSINLHLLQFVARVLKHIAGHTVRVKQHEQSVTPTEYFAPIFYSVLKKTPFNRCNSKSIFNT